MFLDLHDQWPPEPWRPEPPREPRLTPRQERVMLSVVGFNLLLLFVAPIAGVTLFDAIVALTRR